MDKKYKNDLTVITGIHFAKAELKQINGMTFIYDPTWNPDDYAFPTLPVCFFHLKKMNEVMTSDVSQKQLLFYNSQKLSDENAVSGSVLNVVSDNVVVKPKVYKLDTLIPFELLDTTSNIMQNALETIPTVISAQTDREDNKNWYSSVSPWLNLSNKYTMYIKDILKQVMNINFADNWFSGIMGTSDYNKKSLEAMWRGRKILKLKTWDNWAYKYVVITDIDITKEGTDDGFYEASITVQEIPIMTVRETLTGTKLKNKSLTSLAGKGIVKALDGASNLFGTKWS